MKNAHGRTCKKTKVYTYLYISIYENLFENGCIYIFSFMYVIKYKANKGIVVLLLSLIELSLLLSSVNCGDIYCKQKKPQMLIFFMAVSREELDSVGNTRHLLTPKCCLFQ